MRSLSFGTKWREARVGAKPSFRVFMTPVDFEETLTLSRPINLTPARGAGRSVYLYFSTYRRDGIDFSLFISLPVRNPSRTRLLGHGTRAHVVGSTRTVRACLWVSARCILPLETPIPPPEQPSSPSLLWPGLILGGVVSSLQLSILQPKLRLNSVSVTRQHGIGRATVILRCNMVDTDDPRAVMLSGHVDDYADDSLTIAVHDACFEAHSPRLVSSLSATFQWVRRTLRIADATQSTTTTKVEMDMNPTFLGLAVDDEGRPYGNGWPQIIISPRRTRAVAAPQPATLNFPVCAPPGSRHGSLTSPRRASV